MSVESDTDIPLFVDLDGTLSRSDTLVDGVLALVRKRPQAIFEIPAWLLKGKAYFKQKVAASGQLNATALPFRSEIIELVEHAKSQGRKVVLATGADGAIAKSVQSHLGLFAEVIASDGATNLTKQTKLEAILELCDSGEFDYVGDSRDDMPILSASRLAYAPAGTAAANAISNWDNGTVIGSPDNHWRSLIKAIRPHQWAKNVLIFVPIMLAHQLTDAARWIDTLLTFISFCICASAVYVINDLLDLEADRQHSSKRNRPFASGTATPQAGLVVAVTFMLGGLGLAATVSQDVLLAIALYLAITTLYSFYLKRVTMLDVLTLALLYTFRLIAGAIGADVALSFWLLSFSVFLFLSLAFIKRCSELQGLLDKGGNNAAGRGYMVSDLEILFTMGISAGYVSALVLALYVNSPDILRLYPSHQLLWGLGPIFLFWISRVWIKTRRGQMHEDPIVFAIKDRASYVIGALAGVLVLLASRPL